MKGGFHWYYNTLTLGMAVFPVVIGAAIETIAEQVAQDIESYMKAEAPWEDRTGQAREGLSTAVHRQGNDIFIELFYTVDYGIWLEVKYNGQYAIIQPTMERYGPVLMGSLESTFEVAG